MNKIQIALTKLARKYRLEIIYAFGSRAGEIYARVQGKKFRPKHPRSDLDIGIKPAAPLDVQAKVEIGLFFEGLFDVPRVDVVSLPEAPSMLALEIVSGEILFCRSENFEAEYQLYILRRAGDLMPHERLRQKLILES